jgi:hypothetical protein
MELSAAEAEIGRILMPAAHSSGLVKKVRNYQCGWRYFIDALNSRKTEAFKSTV